MPDQLQPAVNPLVDYTQKSMVGALQAGGSVVADDEDAVRHAKQHADQYEQGLQTQFGFTPDRAKEIRQQFEPELMGNLQGQRLEQSVRDRLQYLNSGVLGRRGTAADVAGVIPFAKEIVGIKGASDLIDSAKKLKGGYASTNDYDTLGAHIARMQYDSKAGIGQRAWDAVAQAPSEVAEWMIGSKVLGAMGVGAGSAIEAGGKAAVGGAVKSYLASAGARTLMRADKLAEDTLKGMQPEELGGAGDAQAMAFGKAVLSNFTNNLAFESSGAFNPKTGKSLGDISASTLRALGAAQLAKEANYRAGVGGTGSLPTQLANAKTPEERTRILQDFGIEAGLFGAMEAGFHVLGPKTAPEAAKPAEAPIEHRPAFGPEPGIDRPAPESGAQPPSEPPVNMAASVNAPESTQTPAVQSSAGAGEVPAEAKPEPPIPPKPFQHLSPDEIQQLSFQLSGKKYRTAETLIADLKRRGMGDGGIQALSDATGTPKTEVERRVDAATANPTPENVEQLTRGTGRLGENPAHPDSKEVLQAIKEAQDAVTDDAQRSGNDPSSIRRAVVSQLPDPSTLTEAPSPNAPVVGGSAGSAPDAVAGGGAAGGGELVPHVEAPDEVAEVKAAIREAAKASGTSPALADAAGEGSIAKANIEAEALARQEAGQPAAPGGEPAPGGGQPTGPTRPSERPGIADSLTQAAKAFATDEGGFLDLAKMKEYYDKLVDRINRPGGLLDSFKSAMAPITRSEEARTGGAIGKEALAEMQRKQDVAQAGLKSARGFFDGWIARVTDPAVKMARFLQVTDAIEGGAINTLPTEIQPFAQAIRDLTDERTDAVRTRGIVKTFIDDYFGHLWKKPGSTMNGDEIGKMLGARRALEGKKGFTKERTLASYREGIDAGLEPVSWNPAELALMNFQQVDKAVMAHDWTQGLRDEGLWQFKRLGETPPEGWRAIDDKIARQFIPPVQPGGAGPQLVGGWYTPEPVAKLIDNYLQPGLRGNALYDTARGAGNFLNQAQLGVSAYHGTGTLLNGMMSGVALGVKQISRGDFMKGMGSLAGSPIAPFRNFVEGSKMLKEWMQPGSQGQDLAAMVDAMVKGSGRAKMDAFYNSGAIEAFRSAIKDVQGGDLTKTFSAAKNALPAIAEVMSKPIMEVLVPRMKMGVFADLARDTLANMPNASPDQVRQALQGNWDAVENRLGQLTYDNLFWNRTLKDVAMVSVRSVGWNLGTIRELGGAALDVANPKTYLGLAQGKGMSDRMAYAIALPAVSAIFGALYQYLATGKGPEEPKDYFFPKNGTMTKGVANRVSLPTYMKDMAALTNRYDEGPFRVAGNAWAMARSKMNPVMSTTAEMLNNEDFHGAAIRNPNDPLTRQTQDMMMHLLKQMEPFSARNVVQQVGAGQTGPAVQSMIGITPAPQYINKSFQQQRREELARKIQLSPLAQRQRLGMR